MKLSKKDQDEILTEARKNRKKAEDHERDNRIEARVDIKFGAGEQWDDAELQEREDDGRPALTVNRIPQFVRQITGDMRRNRPSIKVRPVDSAADVPRAQILSGLVRNIEQESDASSAYITAGENAVRGGEGHFRIVTKFTDDDSFTQDVAVERIQSPFAVLWDPDSIRFDKSDANYCFVDSEMDLDVFKETYPKASTNEFEREEIDGDLTDWFTDGKIVVTEYWRKEKTTKERALLRTGETIDVTDMDETARKDFDIVRVRSVESHNVVRYIVNGNEVLEEPAPWLGKYIPIVTVVGEEIHIGERIVRHGIIRWARDPQRLFNYSRTTAAEIIGLAPKTPWLVTSAQIKGYESLWQEANTKSLPYLPYNADAQAAGPPARVPPAAVPIAEINEARQALEDMQAGTGIHNPGLGISGNETSGRQVLSLQQAGDLGTFVYTDNLSRAIAYAGKILIDVIPKVYDTARIIRILGDEDEENLVPINQRQDPEDETSPLVNDITVGKYDTVAQAGPSMGTKRAESASSMMAFASAAPQVAPLILDLIARAQDWPGADKIADRVKSQMPPGIDGEPVPPPPPNPLQEAAFQKAQADTQKSLADAAKKKAEAEGESLDNIQKQLDLAAQSGALQGAIDRAVQQQLAAILAPAIGPPDPNRGL